MVRANSAEAIETTQNDIPQAFYNWALSSGRKPASCKGLKNSVRAMLKAGVDLSNYESIEAFIAKLFLREVSTSHVNNFVSACRVFCQYMNELGVPYDPRITKLKFVKDKYKEKATMSDEEIEALLSLPPATWTRKHNKSGKSVTSFANPSAHKYWTCFFSIMAFTGMRPGEVAKLSIGDVDFGRGVFVLNDTKTNDSRLVPIPKNLYQMIQRHMETLKGKRLFGSKDANGYASMTQWQYNFQTRIKRLGIKRANLTPYSLRHSFVTRMLESDVNIFKVMKIIGHKDVRTTEVYTHLTTKDIISTIQKDPMARRFTKPNHIISMIEEFTDGLSLIYDKRFKIKKTRSNNEFVLSIRVVNDSELDASVATHSADYVKP